MIKKVLKNVSGCPYREYQGESLYIRMQECLMDREPAPRLIVSDDSTNKNFCFIFRSRKRFTEFLVVRYRDDIGVCIEAIDAEDTAKEIKVNLRDFGVDISKAITKIQNNNKLTAFKLGKFIHSALASTKYKEELEPSFNYSKIEKIINDYKPQKRVRMMYKIWA